MCWRRRMSGHSPCAVSERQRRLRVRCYSSASRGVALSGAKLPPLSANQTYQVWLVTTQGSIGLGFVAPDAQGRVSAAFDTPPHLPGGVTGFMLSLEPTGGNAKPTGPIVLAS